MDCQRWNHLLVLCIDVFHAIVLPLSGMTIYTMQCQIQSHLFKTRKNFQVKN